MCGIAGILSLEYKPVEVISKKIEVMNLLQGHRGPDGEGYWAHPKQFVGFGHRRLSIIDLEKGQQPMASPIGNVITYNGEIYNYIELREELGPEYFQTKSDTEALLKSYERWGENCVNHLRGMFAFAIWDEKGNKLFCARDRFGIKPFYYTIVNRQFYFASEAKALLPFIPEIKTDQNALKDYLTFQFCLGEKTLFKDIKQLLPGHCIMIEHEKVLIKKYWEVYYDIDSDRSEEHFAEETRALLSESVKLHLRSDVPVGAYLSGGVDSSIIVSIAAGFHSGGPLRGFTGKFSLGEEYDESRYTKDLAKKLNLQYLELDIKSKDFTDSIRRIIYYLDYPVAGPGSFPQYLVSKLASEHCKVVLGGQGGDEIFGGYVRYLIAYFEQCIRGAIEGTMHDGNFVVTYESILPNLTAIEKYKPLLQKFWREGLFEGLDRRYFRLINRSDEMQEEIRWEQLNHYSPYETFRELFYANNVKKESYFDLMAHFDFKTLLPALLQVEDRMSMAHGLESRVPFLDHPLVEKVATIPSNIKFKDGTLKLFLKNTFKDLLPNSILERKDKMGFPVPLTEWVQGELRELIVDIFNSNCAKQREFINSEAVIKNLDREAKFSRKTWGLLSLELWQQEFHDQASKYKSLLKGKE